LTRGPARQVDFEKIFGNGRETWEKTGEHSTSHRTSFANYSLAEKTPCRSLQLNDENGAVWLAHCQLRACPRKMFEIARLPDCEMLNDY